MFVRVLAVLLLLAGSTTASGKEKEGNTLEAFVSVCSSSEERNQVICESFIHGVIEGVFLGAGVTETTLSGRNDYGSQESRDRTDRLLGVCLPEDSFLEDYYSIIRGYISRSLRENTQFPPTPQVVVIMALRETYQCK